MNLTLLFIKLFFISALLIVSNGNLAMHDSANRKIFWDQYYTWLDGIFDKGVYLTGYVVKSEWLPDTAYASSNNNTLSFP